jgi:iron complex outermembrane receptor protein
VLLDGPISAATVVPRDIDRRLYDDRTDFQQQSYAVYGQVDWQFTPQWKATLGLRWNHDSLKGEEQVRVLCYGTQACTFPVDTYGTLSPVLDVTSSQVWLGGTNGTELPQGVVNNGHPGGVIFNTDGFAVRDYDASWEATTGTVGLQWDPTPGTMMYLRYSRGYLMGGINSGVTSTEGRFPYTDAEHSDDFEFGIKKDFGRTLQVNVDFYYDPIKGYQAPLTVVSNSGELAVSESRYLNIPEALTAGVEVEAIWQPIDNLQISFNYAYDKAEIRKLSGIVDGSDPLALQPGAKPLIPLVTCSDPNAAKFGSCDVNTGFIQRPQDLKGDRLPQIPENKVALAATYTFNFERGSLIPEISFLWRDKQYSGLFTRPIDAAPSWSQTDLRLTWKDRDNKYSIIAYVQNVFDDLGYDGGASASRVSGLFYQSTINALGLTPGSPSTRVPGTFNAVQGISTSYPLTPPRTYGVEFQYRF